MNRKEMIEALQGAFANDQTFTTAEAKAQFSSPYDQDKVFSLLRSIDSDGRAINGRVLYESGDYKRWTWDSEE